MQLQRTQPIGVSSVARGFRVGQINRARAGVKLKCEKWRRCREARGKRICSSRATDLRNLQLSPVAPGRALLGIHLPSRRQIVPLKTLPFLPSYLVAVSHSLPLYLAMESLEWKMPPYSSSRLFLHHRCDHNGKCRTNTFLPSSIDKFCQIILLR